MSFESSLAPGSIYLDWAATAPLCEGSAEAMRSFLTPGTLDSVFGNANSLHTPGRAAFSALEDARRSLARDLHARPNEIIFTSGATEADNAALIGIAHAAAFKRKLWRDGAMLATGDDVPQVIVSAIEHDAVLNPAKALERQGFHVTRLHPDTRGFIQPEVLEEALDSNTVLVSVQMANSEVGAIQPVKQLAELCHRAGALFHTDAVQALGKVPVDLLDLGVDAASFSAHKVGGPKGQGALYLKTRTPFEPQILGGGQEAGLRSGTQNVCGAVGFAAAVKAACDSQQAEAARERGLRDMLYARLDTCKRLVRTVDFDEGSEDFLPNIVHVMGKGIESETLIIRLDQMGFAVSGGSACSTGSLDPSHVLSAMGISRDLALGAVRVSFGRTTTADDLSAFTDAINECLNRE